MFYIAQKPPTARGSTASWILCTIQVDSFPVISLQLSASRARASLLLAQTAQPPAATQPIPSSSTCLSAPISAMLLAQRSWILQLASIGRRHSPKAIYTRPHPLKGLHGNQPRPLYLTSSAWTLAHLLSQWTSAGPSSPTLLFQAHMSNPPH